MSISRRTSFILILFGLLFLLAVLFRSFLLENLVMPVALLFWLFRRMLLSIDQGVYWGLLIFVSAFYFFIRMARAPVFVERVAQTGSSATLETLQYWRTAIQLTSDEIDRPNVLRQDLGQLLVSIYAAREPEALQLQIYDALKQGQIPLPDSIHAFLFPVEALASRRSGWQSVRQILHVAWQMPGKLVRRWTGRDKAQYYRSIEEVLAFMETLLEKNDDNEPFNTPDH